MERILLYVHFNKYKRVSNHVFYQLEQLKPLFSKILFISNSHIEEATKKKLQDEFGISNLLERDNQGYDFAAWRDGMSAVGFEELKNYDSLTLMNDTCFGPLRELEPIYKRFESDAQVDFWGMTNFRKTKYFKEHLQSYFITFKQQILRAISFQEFWTKVKDFTDVQDVIDHYETKFTQYFTEAGFTYQALFDTRLEEAADLIHPDFTYYKPFTILEKKVPFLKVKAITGNPFSARYLLEEIKERTSYPVSLISEHIFEYIGPDVPCLLQDKQLAKDDKNDSPEKPVALHIHVTDFQIFDKFKEKWEVLPLQYQFMVTTADEEIFDQILETVSDRYQVLLGKEENSMQAMLEQSDLLQKFAFVGHISTVNLVDRIPQLDNVMRRELMEMMFENANASIKALERDDKLGLVIPDLPSLVRYGLFEQKTYRKEMATIWQELHCQKNFDFEQYPVFTRGDGGFLWFKPSALIRLFQNDYQLSVQTEPQVLESLLVYLAWDQDYDFKIMSGTPLPALLDLQRETERLNQQKGQLAHKSLAKKVRRYLSNLFKS
ncbi:rhamnan synthesis F family protein [Streptococcus cristatus]|uniref:rhamnan synthesis F family protein n=1 Tax=Streptococcus cristatus TaxID=45634 RepID=UPI0022838CFA|nr:rhamnan synthesis F family protein [Streptococcus cristatus]MCY7217551.1 rhamnan synthesis F family protein [Streptococcus cristatus]